jgi:hypothetical protein
MINKPIHRRTYSGSTVISESRNPGVSPEQSREYNEPHHNTLYNPHDSCSQYDPQATVPYYHNFESFQTSEPVQHPPATKFWVEPEMDQAVTLNRTSFKEPDYYNRDKQDYCNTKKYSTKREANCIYCCIPYKKKPRMICMSFFAVLITMISISIFLFFPRHSF